MGLRNAFGVPAFATKRLGLLIALSILPGASRAAMAAGECLEQPGERTPDGRHWYFHLDRATNRKCWYLGATETQMPQAPPAPQSALPETAASEPVPQPSLSTWFSSMTAGLTAPLPPNAPQGDPRLAEPARNEKTAEAVPPARTRVARRSDPYAPPERKRQPRPQGIVEAAREKPRAVSAPGQAVTPPNATERDALFREYLRWREQHGEPQ